MFSRGDAQAPRLRREGQRARGFRWWRRLARALARVRPLYFLLDALTSMRVVVEGESMAPALVAQQYVLVSRLAYAARGPSRGDVVLARDPQRPEVLCIKRVAGLPGEEVRQAEGELWINGSRVAGSRETGQGVGGTGVSYQWLLSDDEYLVLGDSRGNSRDSRAFGPVKREQVMGKVWFCYWPRARWGRVR